MKKLKLVFTSSPDFSGNVKSLYEYIEKNYKNKFELILIVSNETFIEKYKKRYKCFLIKDCDKIVKSADVVFDTHGLLINIVTEKQIYVNLWHGQGPKKAGYFLGYSNMSDGDKEFMRQIKKVNDFFIVSSEFWRVIFSSLFDININRFIATGLSRTDQLFDSNGSKNLSNILNIDVSKYKKIIFYLPTFRVGLGRIETINEKCSNCLFLKPYKEEDLITFLKKNNYLLVIKKHQSEQMLMPKLNSKYISYLNDEMLSLNNISLYEVLNSADLLLTDYSSVYIDYLILNKPVMFLNYDKELYIKNRGIVFDNIDFWCPGPQVEDLSSFKKNVLKSLNNNSFYKEERDRFIKIMHNNIDNNSSKRICDFLFVKNKIKPEVIKLNEELSCSYYNNNLKKQGFINKIINRILKGSE